MAERVEALGQQARYREKYDWAVARALATMPVLLEYLLPLVRVGGKVLAQKGQTAKLSLVCEINERRGPDAECESSPPFACIRRRILGRLVASFPRIF